MQDIHVTKGEYYRISCVIRATGSLGRRISRELLDYFGQLFDRLSNIRVTASNYGPGSPLSRWILRSRRTNRHQNSEARRPRGCLASSAAAPTGCKLQQRQLFARRQHAILFSYKRVTTVFLLSLRSRPSARVRSNYWRVYVQLCTDYVITCAVSHYCSRPRRRPLSARAQDSPPVRSQTRTCVGLLPL